MTDLQKNKATAKVLIQGWILEQVGKGRELPEWEITGEKFIRTPLEWVDEFINEMLDSSIIVSTIIQDGEKFDAALRLA